MSKRFIVETSNHDYEDVAAAEVHFGPTHVVFIDEDGALVIAYRGQDVLTVVQDDDA